MARTSVGQKKSSAGMRKRKKTSSLSVTSTEGRTTLTGTVPSAAKRDPAESKKIIERVAYELYRQRNAVPGNDWADWFQAERMVLTQQN